MNILAIDQGTSSTKALVVGEGALILATADVPVHPAALADGGVEQDPEELWRSVLEAGRQALAAAGEPVEAIGLANQGETVLAWDPATGDPLSVALSWQDRRATDVCDRLADRADWLRTVTGLPLDPYFAAPKMTRIRERLTRHGVVTTSDAWLVNRLTGAFVTDAATASRTLLLDLDRTSWCPPACEAFGLGDEPMPEIVPCAGVVGETRAFGPVLPVAGLAVDQQAALFAEACHAPREAKCTFGTGAFLLANVGETAQRSKRGLAACIAWLLGGRTTYCLDGQVYSAGSAVGWLGEIGLIRDARDLDLLGGSVSSTAGVAFVPGLAGMAAPFWRPNARGAFVGLSLATSRAQLVRAVVEGVASAVAWLARAVGDDLGQPLERLRVDGGLTRSNTLMQIQADLLQAPIDVYPSPNATALGVAAFARIGIGDVQGGMGLARDWKPVATFEPRISADEAHGRLARWRAAADATIDIEDERLDA
ncbi:MAG TPA: FGGY family carbohydrate kinase [Patescibacteria group bacterium]|nr:FGGY family carbohydrate kinase [Patescibacteria group bacterium]